MHMTRGFITVAFGPQEYIDNAVALARSLKLSGATSPIALVTDRPPEAFDQFDQVIRVEDAAALGLLTKLRINEYSPYDETVFIDSDCLVVRSPEFLWERFGRHSFTMVGIEKEDGEWYGADIAELRDHFAIDGPLPQFNSGLIYWRDDETSRAVFAYAQSLWHDYENLGLRAFREEQRRGDEPLFSIAMAVEGAVVELDDGTMMNTPVGLRGRMLVDLTSKQSQFRKGSRWVSPAIVHFCGDFRHGGTYRREAEYLRLLAETNIDVETARRTVKRAFFLRVVLDAAEARAVRHRSRLLLLRLRGRDVEGVMDAVVTR